MTDQEQLNSEIRYYELKNAKLEAQNEECVKDIELLGDILKIMNKMEIEELIEEKKKKISINENNIEKNNKYLVILRSKKTSSIYDLLKLINLPDLNFGEKMNSTATETKEVTPNSIYEWPQFYDSLYEFEQSINEKFFEKKYDPYVFNRFVLIMSHDDVVFQILTICNEIFTKRILSDDLNAYFHACPNSAPIKGDVYFKDKFFIEVKTPKTLPIKSNLIGDYKANLPNAKKSIIQTYGYMCASNLEYALLSTYNSTWLFYNVDKSLFISPLIPKNKLVLALFYALALRDKSIHEETIKVHKENFKKLNEKLKLNLDLEEEDCTISEIPFKEKELNQEDYFVCEELEKEFPNLESIIDCINDSIRSCEPIGGGASGVVVKVVILDKEYALKMIDLYKEYEMLPEIKNEIDILKYLNTNNVKNVPKLYFGGKVNLWYCLLMSYIKGESKELNQLCKNEKDSYIKGIDQLHKIFCLHGDIRSENFICENDRIHVIDFGRSRIVNDSDESQNMLKKEMEGLKKLISEQILD